MGVGFRVWMIRITLKELSVFRVLMTEKMLINERKSLRILSEARILSTIRVVRVTVSKIMQPMKNKDKSRELIGQQI